MILQSRDIEAVSTALLRLYALDDVDRFPSGVVEVMQLLVPGNGHAYNEVDPVRRHVAAVMEPWPITPALQAAMDTYLHQHPVIQQLLRSGDDRALMISDFLSTSEFHRLELYGELYRQIEAEDQIAIGLQVGTALIGLAINRDRASFAGRDRQVLDLLRPHVISTRRNVAALSLARQALEANGVGTILVGPTGTIDEADPWTLGWLRRHFGRDVARRRGLPRDLQAWLAAVADRRAAGPEAPPTPPLIVGQGDRRLTIRLASFSPTLGATLVLREEAREVSAPADLAARLGLTRREVEIVDWLDCGASDAEIADALVLSRRTVYKHLQNIFGKLDVRSRMAVVARLRGQ